MGRIASGVGSGGAGRVPGRIRGRMIDLLWRAMPAGLAGAFFALAVGRVAEPAEANRLQLLGLGWLYGVVVLGLIRIFPVVPWGRPLAGLLCGPVPVVLVLRADLAEDERLAAWLLGALLGLVIGALECARQQREERSHDAR